MLRRALFTLEPELAHALTLSALQLAGRLRLLPQRRSDPFEAISLMGLRFPNRVGLAAGFDKSACCIDALGSLGFVAVNVSSLNTPDLRRLQRAEYLRPILDSLLEEREALTVTLRRPLPLLLKLSPDLSFDELGTVARLMMEVGVDGVIATNSTITRPAVPDVPARMRAVYAEEGGLSGEPLRSLALDTVRILRSVVGARVPIVAVGGIASAADALAALDAGASLVQIYTGLIYQGPALISDIRRAVVRSA